MNIHKNLTRIKTVALFQAIEHDCNYNVILCNPVNGEFDEEKSTYEIVKDGYFDKERENVIKVITTDELKNDKEMMDQMPNDVKKHFIAFQDDMDNVRKLSKQYNTRIPITNPYPKDDEPPGKVEQVVNTGPDINRNDPCHCGSGKKYKRCCLNK